MTTSTTDAEAIARIVRLAMYDSSASESPDELSRIAGTYASAILSYLAPRRATQEPVAWRYRWKIDGEWVSWRVSERSQASEHLLPSLEEYPLYLAPPAPAGEVERLREALQGALAEHDHKRKMQVMLTEPEWVEKARAARKGMGNE